MLTYHQVSGVEKCDGSPSTAMILMMVMRCLDVGVLKIEG